MFLQYFYCISQAKGDKIIERGTTFYDKSMFVFLFRDNFNILIR